ncbi:MAG: DinB family protein [Opitutales bacterium]
MSFAILHDNLQGLEQALALLATLSDADLATPEPACFNSTIGGHLRHNADHYSALLDGLAQGKVDYDARHRDHAMEVSVTAAGSIFRDLSDRLSALESKDLDDPIQVTVDTGSGGSTWAASSLRRELQFLLSHSIHHYALIATICQLRGLQTPETFGVAPSTLRHRGQLANA